MKPPVGTEIDFSNPFVKDMFFFCKLDEVGDQTNLIDGRKGVKILPAGSSTLDLRAGRYGLANWWDFNSAGDENGFDFGNPPEYGPPAITALARFMADGEYTSGWNRIVSKHDGAVSDDYALLSSTSTSIGCRISNSDSSLAVSNHDGKWHEAYVSQGSGESRIFRVYNLETGQRYSTSAGPTVVDQNGGNLTVGHRYTQDRSWDGFIDYIALWNQVKSEEFINEFRANPWQVFKPRRILVPLIDADVVAAIAAGATLEADGTASLESLLAAGVAYRTAVKITDVNTTESWFDGDTTLPITGSGFV